MLHLFCSVLTNALKGYSTKKISGDVVSFSDNVVINVYRNILCVVIGFAYLMLFGGNLAISLSQLLTTAVAGVSMATFLMAWLYSVKSGAYMMVSAFTSGSFIVPFLYAVSFLNEKLTWQKISACVVMCGAMYLLCCYNNKIKTRLSFKSVMVLILVSVSYGTSQIAQKIYNTQTNSENTSAFTFYMFVFATLTLVLLSLVLGKKGGGGFAFLKNKRVIIYASIAAAALFFTTYFQTVAAKIMDATVLYPLSNGLTLVAGTLMSVFFFSEKMKKESALGIATVFLALILYKL